MFRRLTDRDGFVADVDPAQPRIVVTIEGVIALDDGERALRDHMVKEYVEALVTAVRAYYDVRRMLGTPKRPVDEAKLEAAIAQMEVASE